MKVGAISLGCDKNRTDTEQLLGFLVQAGHTIVNTLEDADAVIVGTCAFLQSAINESIEAILEARNCKNVKYVIAAGCFPMRFSKEVEKQDFFSEVDAFLDHSAYHRIGEVLDRLSKGEKVVFLAQGEEKRSQDRVLTTPGHYAYLKVADGCDNHCTFCAIPAIRGAYRSVPIETLVQETERLIAQGVVEIILVAQDVTGYGADLYGESRLLDLLRALVALPIEKIRLLYCYPDRCSDELIDFIDSEPKMAKYIDMPMQHASDTVLKRMNRKDTVATLRDRIRYIRSKASGIAIRSTFMVGFPQESEEEFKELCDFLEEQKLDHVGFFAYSKEDGTPAARMKGQVPYRVKRKRLGMVLAIQTGIRNAKAESLMGKVVRVMADGIDYDKSLFYGHTERMAPDVDGAIYFASGDLVEEGNVYSVRIEKRVRSDLYGQVLGSEE